MTVTGSAVFPLGAVLRRFSSAARALGGVAILVAISMGAAVAQDEAEPFQVERIDAEWVDIDGIEYFKLRGAESISAAERVKFVEAAIIEAAELDLNKAPLVVSEPSEFGVRITADGIEITQITEGDAEYEGFELDVVAHIIVSRIEDAITAYRLGRSSGSIWEGVGSAALWTVVYAAFVTGLMKARHWQRRRVDERVHRWLQRIEEQSGRVIDATSLLQAHRMLARGALTIIIALAT